MTSRALPNRRSVLTSIAAAGAFAASGARAQSNWPDHPVRILVPYPAGGSTDVLSRILAERMKEIFGQPFVIENRPGAGGNIGIAAVTGSPPDGYTIGAATIGHFAINQFLYNKMPFDAERDMVPASLTCDHCPAKTVSEFISWAKQKGRVSYGSPGVGTSPHLSGVMFVRRTGLDAVHVPFRGAAQTIPAMLAGDVNFAIDNLTSYVPAISSGKIRALAVTAAKRWPTMADVPTMEEAGMKDFVVTSWAAFVFPVGTPRPIIDKVAGAMKKIAGEEEVQKRFQVGGALLLSSTPEEALAYAAKERAMWKDVVAASGAKID
jgi:tripartite-type tricarboxylate transporter receptor subunit TctC